MTTYYFDPDMSDAERVAEIAHREAIESIVRAINELNEA